MYHPVSLISAFEKQQCYLNQKYDDFQNFKVIKYPSADIIPLFQERFWNFKILEIMLRDFIKQVKLQLKIDNFQHSFAFMICKSGQKYQFLKI